MGKSGLLKFYELYDKAFENASKDQDFIKNFYNHYLSGEREVYQKYISETKNFDEEWINTLESYIPSLNKIVLNPRSTLKSVEEIVPAELAKKVDAKSIQHLSSNTHLIKEVKDDGDVIPSRVMTSYADVDYGTYENRFIMTLIDRLFFFVRNRYQLVKDNIDSHERRRLHLKSDFPVNDTKVEVEIDFTLIDDTADKQLSEYNDKILERVEYLNKIVTSLRSSQFMQLMKDQRRIYPPIMKTNVILKNVDFRNAYMLWLFLDRYNTLAFAIDVKEKDLTFTDKYYDDLNRQMLTLYSTIVSNQEMNKEEYENIIPKNYQKNSIKVQTKHPKDIVMTPEDEVMEDMTLNEYYLNQNMQIFKQSIEYHEQHSRTYETSIKRALRETLNISNALYEAFFELEEDDDIFRKLITEVDVTKELAEARRKLLISKMIREVKEVDFNDALRREKKILDEIAKYDGLLLKEYNAKLELSKKELEEKAKLEEDRALTIEKKKLIDAKLAENKRLSKEINDYRRKINKQINDYQRELNNKLKKELSNYEKELDQNLKAELEKYAKEHEVLIATTNRDIMAEERRINMAQRERYQALEAQYKERLEIDKLKVKKRMESSIIKKKQTLRQNFLENEANIKRIEDLIKSHERNIYNYERTLRSRNYEELERFELEQEERLKVELAKIK